MSNILANMKQLFINPVLDKEYRLRMRSAKSMWTLLSYLLAIGLFATATFFIVGIESNGAGIYTNDFNEILFIVMSFAQLGLIAFMAPGLTAGVISGEREKQTLNLLLTTQQSSSSIIISKLVSSLSFMFLIVFSTLPIYGIVFLYGGVSPSQLLAVFGFFLFNMLIFGGFGILFSTLFKRTMLAVIVTYGIVLFMFAGTGVIFLICFTAIQEYIYNGSNNTPAYVEWIIHILAFNPACALLSIFEPEIFKEIVNRTTTTQKGFYDYIPMWLEYMLIYTVILVICLWQAIRKLRPTRGSSKRGL
ncbi:MAG TPA: ABC transporter permease subunit [Candidatus Paenibacillus intestinavium]|nr:ABC transporter permease subunit [Candidatus Paenibacillus intestinavium]